MPGHFISHIKINGTGIILLLLCTAFHSPQKSFYEPSLSFHTLHFTSMEWLTGGVKCTHFWSDISPQNFCSVQHFKVFPYICIGSHAFAVFAHKNYGHAGYIDDLLPNMGIWMLACIVLLCIHVWWFSDHFFSLLSVWSPCYTLSRKIK